MTSDQFSTILPTIPTNPGIYKYFNSANEIIYVGKANNLRKRVSSYFNKTVVNRKTAELVYRIDHIEFTIVDNEHDALLLENSLIKEYQPTFNINLKDDKTYPYIVIKNEPFPRVFFTRKKIDDKSTYFGPYTSVVKVRDLLDLIKESIPLRTCKLNLSDTNINRKKFKVCLEYHLGKCKGPCEGLQSKEDYKTGIESIISLLKGNLNPVEQELKKQMKAYSENMEFEKARVVQSRIEYIHEYKAKSLVVNNKTGTIDVFSILEEGDTAYVNYLAINEGSIVQTKTITLEKKLEETKEEVLVFAIARMRQTFNSGAKEIILPFPIIYPEIDVLVTVPKAGDKKKLLELSEKNVNFFRAELHAKKLLKLEDKSDDEKKEILKQLQIDLHLPTLPLHIECFDNSNFQGSHPVAAMVCFKEGEPNKKEYRRYNIKTVVGINDFASMQEVVLRRYKRLLTESLTLPQLVIIDGGKGQLNAALESIRQLGIENKMTVIGLAKNQEELFFPGDTESIKLPWNSESLKLIRRVRDEVHRFGVQFHRSKRSKAAIKNELEIIKGIGRQTADLLLSKYKSVKKIKELSQEELSLTIGIHKAVIIKQALAQDSKNQGKEY